MDQLATDAVAEQLQQQDMAYSQYLDFPSAQHLFYAENVPQPLQQHGSQGYYPALSPDQSSLEEGTLATPDSEKEPEQVQGKSTRASTRKLHKLLATRKKPSPSKSPKKRDSRIKDDPKLPSGVVLGPKQRATTADEIEYRRVEKVLRNRKSAGEARNKKKNVEALKNEMLDKLVDQRESFIKDHPKFENYFLQNTGDEKKYRDDRKKREQDAAEFEEEQLAERAAQSPLPGNDPTLAGLQTDFDVGVQPINTTLPTQPMEAHNYAHPQDMGTANWQLSDSSQSPSSSQPKCERCQTLGHSCSPLTPQTRLWPCGHCSMNGMRCSREGMSTDVSMAGSTTVGGIMNMKMTFGTYVQTQHEPAIQNGIFVPTGRNLPVRAAPIQTRYEVAFQPMFANRPQPSASSQGLDPIAAWDAQFDHILRPWHNGLDSSPADTDWNEALSSMGMTTLLDD